jgi:hypothetical protein
MSWFVISLVRLGVVFMDQNPYQAPAAEIAEVIPGVSADAVEIRQEHIGHEASVRSIGILYYIGAIAMILTGGISLFALSDDVADVSLFLTVFFIGFGVLYLWMGSALRALSSKVRHVAGVFAGLGLLGFPIGTLINGYILYLLYSKKGKMVFSEEYQAIRQATPDIKYKTSVIVWVFLIIILLLLAAAILVPMIEGRL